MRRQDSENYIICPKCGLPIFRKKTFIVAVFKKDKKNILKFFHSYPEFFRFCAKNPMIELLKQEEKEIIWQERQS